MKKKDPEAPSPPEDEPQDPMALFREAVGDVKRLHDDHVADKPAPPPPTPRQFELDEKRVMHDAMFTTPTPEDTGEHLSWARSGVQKRVMRKLRNGYYAVQAELDLHGMTVNDARTALAEFIQYVTDHKGSCCVRVIHGKGRKTATDGPVLKPFTASYLRNHSRVIAYTSAPRTSGGTGALYVLVRGEHRD
jgi:DNA-nicking Smr family endonuclease